MKQHSDTWYTVSFDFKTTEEPPLDAWEFIQWLRRVQPIAYDNIRLVKPVESRVVEIGDTDG